MTSTKDKLLNLASRVADTAVTAGTSLVEKGKQKADLIALKARLRRTQQKLGALVYSLQKTGDTAEGVVARYIDEIDQVQAQIDAVQAPGKQRVKVYSFGDSAENGETEGFVVAAVGKNNPQDSATVVTYTPKTAKEKKKAGVKRENT